MDNFDLKKYLAENRFQPVFYDINDADEIDFSESDEVSFIFNDDSYETDSDSWEDERFTITVDIDIIKNFLYDQSKNEITIPVLNGDGIIKLDKEDAESIMDSFYGNYPYLDPTSPEYEGPGGFSLNEAEGNDLYYTAGEMISQVGLFTQEKADELEAEGRGNLNRFLDTPEEKSELIKISEEYKNYLAKVKATMDALVNDPMYQVAVGDVGGQYRDKGVGATLEKAYMRSKNI